MRASYQVQRSSASCGAAAAASAVVNASVSNLQALNPRLPQLGIGATVTLGDRLRRTLVLLLVYLDRLDWASPPGQQCGLADDAACRWVHGWRVRA